MITIKSFFTIIFFGFLAACDPTRTLVIRTADKPNLSVTIFGNKNLLPDNKSATEKVVVKISSDANSERRDTAFRYGLGGWDKKYQIPGLVANIDSIIIKNSSGTLLLKNKEELTSYLLTQRSGQSGCVITIEAK
jgi:hypothetical protein